MIFLLSLPSLSVKAAITMDEWNQMKQKFLDEFASEVSEKLDHCHLEIRLDPTAPDIATSRFNRPSYGQVCKILVAPAYLETPFIRADEMEAMICHEVGHLLGDPTYEGTFRMASEGEADYYGSSVCLPKFWTQYPPNGSVENSTELKKIEEKCIQKYSDPLRQKICLKSVDSGLTSLIPYAHRGEYDPKTFEFDGSYSYVRQKGRRIEGYPSLACRYTTIVNGALGLPRPACWTGTEEK